MFRKLKQIISVLLISVLAISVFPMQTFAWSAPATGTDWTQLDRTGIKARFAVGSDIHIGSGYESDKKLENALNVFKTIDPNMDAVMFAGDLTDNGYATQYDTMMSIANNSSLGDKIIWSMGNHEYYGWTTKQEAIDMFTNKTGQVPDKVCTACGITIITLGSHSYDGGSYSDQYDFLANALSNAAAQNPNAPIFVIAHHGVWDSAYTTDEWYGNYGVGTDKDMIALMAQYPQVIHISGHSHATVDTPTSIDQSKGFTCIQDATLGAYFENESGKIVSDGRHSTYPEYTNEASQALLIDVDDSNKVIIKRMNLTSGKYIYGNEPWVIDVPNLVANKEFTYTKNRADVSKAPVFADGSQVTVTQADSGSVTFSFSQATAADGLNDNMVHAYKMKVTNTSTGEVIRDTSFNRDYFLRFSDYYRSAQALELSAKIAGLAPSTGYKIEVWALTPYSVESSNSICTTFTTAAETIIPTITSELTTEKPVIDGSLNDSVWSIDNKIQKDMNNNATHNAGFDVRWDNENVYLAVQIKGDAELAAGTAWSKGDIVWVYFDPTLHASTPYADGDWQIGIGYNPVDNSKPYIIMGGGVKASAEVKAALAASITAATVPTADGWNAEIAIPWDKLGIDVKTKHELGFDLSVDNYQTNKDLEALTWCNSNWNDTSGFGRLILSNNSILDVDFSDGTAKDNSSAAHTAVMKGNPVISDNSDLGKKMASFDGDDDAYAYNLTASDYENIKNSFTMECMMKLKQYVNGDPFMDCDGAGLGFELNSDGKTLEFWGHINGSYTVPAVDISDIKSEWVHATATYDGTELKIYINGKLKKTQTVTGSLDIPQDSAKWLMIGSDTGSDGSVQLPIACDISNARLYGGAMNANEVAALYVQDNPVTFTLSDTNALTGTVGQTVIIPSATAKNANGACEVSTTLTGPDGENIAISNNTFTPTTSGKYTITYAAQGQMLTKTVTVGNASGVNAILDVDFSDGTAKDNSPEEHTAVMKGNPVIADNSDLGKKMASFDGQDDAYAYNLTSSDYENIKNSFTMECMMKLNQYVNGDPFMDCDGAGLGFELNGDGKTLEFWAHINGSYTVPAADISEIKSGWVHATTTYDGSAIKLYINGELKATQTVSGSLDIPQDSAKWLMIGSDSGSDGSVQLPIACGISNARLYSGAMDADEVAELYVKDNPVTFTLSDTNALTGTVGQTVIIPSATAKNANGACEVSTTVTGVNGENVTIINNAFTPVAEGNYTITYTAQGQKLTKDVAVSAKSSNSDGSNSSSNNLETYQAVVSGTGMNSTQPIDVDAASESATVDLDTLQGKVFTSGVSSAVNVPSIPGVNNYSVDISASLLAVSEHKGSLLFSTELGSLTIPDNMLAGIPVASGKKAGITIGDGDKSKLSDSVKAAIGERPLVQLTLTVDGIQKEWNNPDAPVTVSIPYTPSPTELKNLESIIVWYIDGNGKAISVPNGHYDPATGKVTFTTTHFSNYAVSFNKVDFYDVATDKWYSKAVGFIAARDITTGTGNNNYSPEARLTRGEYIVMLMNAYGITPGTNSNDNFSDAGNTYYTGYLAKAKESGIANGIGSNLFAPNKEITRQEMLTLLYNALKVIGQLPEDTTGRSLSDFSDNDRIASWAKDAMTLFVGSGVIQGSKSKLMPTDTTTRGELAQVLYNLLTKKI